MLHQAHIQSYIADLLECKKGKVVTQVKRFLSQEAITAVILGHKRLSSTKQKWFLDWNDDVQSEFNQIALNVAAAGFVEKATTDWMGKLPDYASDINTVHKSMVAHVKYLLTTRKSLLATAEAKARRVAAGKSFLSGGASPGPSAAGPSSAGLSNLRKSRANPDDDSPESDAELERMTKLSLSRRRQRKKTVAAICRRDLDLGLDQRRAGSSHSDTRQHCPSVVSHHAIHSSTEVLCVGRRRHE